MSLCRRYALRGHARGRTRARAKVARNDGKQRHKSEQGKKGAAGSVTSKQKSMLGALSQPRSEKQGIAYFDESSHRTQASPAHDEAAALLGALALDQTEAADAVDVEEVAVIKHGSGRPTEPKQLEGSLYDHPMYYDWAFGYRNYEEEVDFLFDMYEELIGDEPSSFVELGCGPAQHSLEMAESQLDVYCVDRNERMLSYASSLAAADDLAISCLHQDMRSFELPGGKQVNLVAALLGTIQDLTSTRDAIDMFRAVERALTPGGLFVVELSHPALLFDGSITSSADTWTLELEEAQLEVWFGCEGDRFDAMSQVLHKTVEVNIMMRGGDVLQSKHVMPMRHFTYQELALIASTAGLEVRRLGTNAHNAVAGHAHLPAMLSSKTVVQAYDGFSLTETISIHEASGRLESLTRDTSSDGENPKKPASAPSDDDQDPFRLILVCQKQE